MNRVHSMVLAAVLTVVGGLGVGASSVQAQAPSGAAAVPRYYYGPGYNGYRYYSYPTAPAAPTYRGGFYSTTGRSSSGGTSTSRPAQDYTGRHDGLARPWLRPLP